MGGRKDPILTLDLEKALITIFLTSSAWEATWGKKGGWPALQVEEEKGGGASAMFLAE